MNNKKTIKKILSTLSWIFITISIVFLIFGFGEDGFKLLKVTEFWVVVNSLWVLTILIFTIENRIRG
jgi:hypothetical protein